jgi:hypothetical protein
MTYTEKVQFTSWGKLYLAICLLHVVRGASWSGVPLDMSAA